MAGPRVLVVDDDAVIVTLLQTTFEMEDFTVLTATDGVQGLEMARGERPEVVVTDLMMPDVSGLDLLASLKADPETAAMPVVVLSAKAQTADVQAGHDAGADDYITKPFEPFDLIDRVNQILGR